MNELIKQLKIARELYAQSQEETAKVLAKLQQTKLWQEYQETKASEEKAKLNVVEIDETVRVQALNVYFQTNNKKPADGVSIIINKEIMYDKDDAISWAKNNAPTILTLDIKNFERYAKNVHDVSLFEFVKFEEVPSVRIAKDL